MKFITTPLIFHVPAPSECVGRAAVSRTDLPWICCCCLILACGVGCEDAAIREYVVEREQKEFYTSDLLRDEYSAVPFRWTVPSDWKTADNDQFSKFAWQAGGSDGARITVSDLPGTAGIAPQFSRWRDQLQLPRMESGDIMKSVEQISLKGMTGQWIELRGETESILGMIVSHKDKLWVIKYRSSNSVAETQRAGFRNFCESLAAG